MVEVSEWLKALEGVEKVSLGWVFSGWWFRNGGLYVIYRGDIPVYVGFTVRSIRQRLQGHITHASRSLLGEALCESYDFSVRVLGPVDGLLDGELPERVELALIKELRPEYNRAGLLPSQRVGVARERYEEEQERDRRHLERQAYRREFWHKALGRFQDYIGGARGRARLHISSEVDKLGIGEELDTDALGDRAFEIFCEVLEERGLIIRR